MCSDFLLLHTQTPAVSSLVHHFYLLFILLWFDVTFFFCDFDRGAVHQYNKKTIANTVICHWNHEHTYFLCFSPDKWAFAEPARVVMNPPASSQKGRSAPAAAPDGGYAWFVLLSCFLVFGLTFGVIKAFGVFYVEIHTYFGTTATGTSWITSIAVATIHIVGNYNFFFHH